MHGTGAQRQVCDLENAIREPGLTSITGFFWAGACFLLCVWTYFRLPEPKGRTYGELDVLFEHKVSARKFHKTKVDQFAGEHTEIVQETSDSDVEKALHEHKA